MGTDVSFRRVVRFGAFQADLQTGELRKHGRKIRLQEKPFQILTLLLERPGGIVTREEVRHKLWNGHTAFDFDHSAANALHRLRAVLGDSAENPRFIETVPRQGYRFLADVVTQVEPDPSEEHHSQDHDKVDPMWRRLRAAIVILSVLLVAALAAFVGTAVHHWKSEASGVVRRFDIPSGSDIASAVVSPDGRHIAYVSDRQLWVHDLETGEARFIEGTEGAKSPFWTPDSESIAYAAMDEFSKVSLAGGPPARLFGKPATNMPGATFSPSGDSIIFSLFRLSGWELCEFVLGQDEFSLLSRGPGWESMSRLFSPQLLPVENGRRVLLFQSGPSLEGRLLARDLDSGETISIGTGANPFYSPTGHIVYQTSGTDVGIRAVRFSVKELQVTGESFSISERGESPSVARDGTLVYLDRGPPRPQRLVWRSRDGEELGTVGQQQQGFGGIALSPGEDRVAATGMDGGNYDIWIHDVERPVKTRITFDPAQDVVPLWSPHGDQIIFTSPRRGEHEAFLVPTDGSKNPELLLESAWAESWSTDGKTLLFSRDFTLWSVELDDGRVSTEPVEVLPFWVRDPRLSPDGSLVTYAAKELGQWDVYVCEFPGGRNRVRVSADGGLYPKWRGDSREIYFVNDGYLLAAPVTKTPPLQVTGPVQKLFALSGGSCAVSTDGQRFVVAEPVGESETPVIRVVENWHEEFRDRQ